MANFPILWYTRLRAVSYFSLQSYCTRNLTTRAAKPRAARNEGVSQSLIVIITSWFAVALDEIRSRRILREKTDCKESTGILFWEIPTLLYTGSLKKSTPLGWNLRWSFRSGMGEGWGTPNGTSLFSVDINTISKVARHLVMKNKNWNLLQLEMGKYFQRIITIFIYNCERFEPRSHFIITFTRTIILSLLKNIYILIVYLGISSFFWR